jgi:hypothetical protein
MLCHLNAYQSSPHHHFLLQLVADDIAAFQIFLGTVSEKTEIAVYLVGMEQGCSGRLETK